MSRRLIFRAFLVAGLVGAALLSSGLSVQAVPAPAAAWSVPLVLHRAGDGVVESEPVAAEATVAGLSWEGAAPQAAWVRASRDGASWTEWTEIELEVDHGPDPGSAEAAGQRSASEPVYLGEISYVQYRLLDGEPARVRGELVETAGRQLGLLEKVDHFFRGLTWRPVTDADAVPDQPAIISRAEWGGDQCLGSDPEPPVYVRHVEAMFVHHTSASSSANSYSEAEAADYVYALCSYHVNGRGWRDIGYNFLIDRFGNIYEGRAGGVDRGVYGAHTRGFNFASTAVAFLGYHDRAAPTVAAQAALVELAAWKLDLHHVDPAGAVTLESMGSSRFEEGESATIPRVAGHRDTGYTACPGWACYTLLPDFRSLIAETGGPKIFGGWPDQDPIPGSPEVGYEPARFGLRFTHPTDWSLEIRDVAGEVMFSRAGSGTSAQLTWDGTYEGGPAPMGEYTVTLLGTTAGGDPRPVSDSFQLGDFVPPFRDDEGLSHESNIILIAEVGITQGCDVELYCPSNPVTRAQMATFLARALQLPPTAEDFFSDDANSGHEQNINRLAAAGVTSGCRAGEFCPDQPMTRAQMAALLARALGDLPSGTGDYFTDDNGHQFEAEINRLAEAGITQGCGPSSFCPSSTVTRAQMASFLARAFLEGGV